MSKRTAIAPTKLSDPASMTGDWLLSEQLHECIAGALHIFSLVILDACAVHTGTETAAALQPPMTMLGLCACIALQGFLC